MDLRRPWLDGVDATRVVAAGQLLLAPRVTRGIIERFVAQHPADKAVRKRAELLNERELEVLRFMSKASRTPGSASACTSARRQ
jgi:DNA-binding NarL/FixJ family response regulator